jgi:hypothetical protein
VDAQVQRKVPNGRMVVLWQAVLLTHLIAVNKGSGQVNVPASSPGAIHSVDPVLYFTNFPRPKSHQKIQTWLKSYYKTAEIVCQANFSAESEKISNLRVRHQIAVLPTVATAPINCNLLFRDMTIER